MINWSLLQPVDIAGQFQQGLERGRTMARQRAVEDALSRYPTVITENPSEKDIQLLAAYAPQQLAAMEGIRNRRAQAQEAEREATNRRALGSIYASGNREGAINQAVAGGDLELAKQFQSLNPDQKAKVKDKLAAAAPFAYQALKMQSPEERRAFIQSNADTLIASGWEPELIQNYQGDEATLQNIVVGASTLEQMRERDTIQYKSVEEGARLVPFDAFGRPVSADTGGAPSSAPVAPPAVPATSGGGALSFAVPEGATMTSGYRDPAHNRRVGGVANSYHMQRTPDGQPMARDYVPGRSGMSMGALEAYARQNNPGMDVINEGDHVHLEPRTVRAARRKSGTETPPKGRMDSASVRAQAQAAIAAGADPVKVRQRAAEMGVSL